MCVKAGVFRVIANLDHVPRCSFRRRQFLSFGGESNTQSTWLFSARTTPTRANRPPSAATKIRACFAAHAKHRGSARREQFGGFHRAKENVTETPDGCGGGVSKAKETTMKVKANRACDSAFSHSHARHGANCQDEWVRVGRGPVSGILPNFGGLYQSSAHVA
jgi:hypothetical protein